MRRVRPFELALWATCLAGACGIARADDEAVQHGPGRATSHRSFADVEQWKAVFDDPKRDEWQKPGEVIRALRIKEGQRVADLGAGTGYFLPHLSRAVGAIGVVYAVEVEPTLVAHLRQRAEEGGFPQVVPVLASKDNPRLPTGQLDLVLIVDTFHHIDHRAAYLANLKRALAPLGRVAVIDWRKEPLPEGPAPEHKLPPAQVVAEVTAAGFELVESPDFLAYQYVLVFRNSEAHNSAPRPQE